MLTFIPSTSIFCTTLLTGTLISLSSPQWLIIWAGLELNLISFIPLITRNYIHREREAAIKYFISQALGSSLLLLGAITSNIYTRSPLLNTPGLGLTLAGLLLKIGAAPLHIWFPQVIGALSWPLCIALSTWQKLAPFTLISTANPNQWYVYLAITGSIVGGLGGLNQAQLRPLLAYSSIGHMGWMLGALYLDKRTSYIYLTIYIIISARLMATLHINNSTTRTINSIKHMPQFILIVTSILLLSLAGMPPFIGFFPKWAVIQSITTNYIYAPAILLIIGALINLFYYLSISMNIVLIPKSPRVIKTSNTQLVITSSLVPLNTAPLLFLFTYALAILHKPQRHRYNILYFRDLIRPTWHIYKTSNPSGARTTRVPIRERPTI